MSRQWFPLYVNDYMGDTMRFTTEEHGAYILILIDYWAQQRPPPDDDRVLRQIAKVSRHKWMKISPILRSKFCIENGVWKHRRIEEEMEKAKSYSKIQAERRKGKTGATKNRRKTDGLSTDKPPTPTPTKQHSVSKDTADDGPLDLDALLYREGKKLLGKNRGAMLTKLKAAVGLMDALKVIETAQRKDDPAAYVAGACKRGGDRQTEQDRAQAAIKEIFDHGRSAAH